MIGAALLKRIAFAMSCGTVVLALLLTSACHGRSAVLRGGDGISRSRQVANLHAFGRLYGMLRWFHPSDAAAEVDWDRFAIDGVRQVIDASDPEGLQVALTRLVAPFAPTVQISRGQQRFNPAPARGASPASELIAWEHQGYGDSTLVSEYASKRRHRSRVVPAPGNPLAALWQAVDAAPFRGARVRLRGKLRVAGHGRGRLWVRVDRGDQRGFFDTMSDRPIGGARWQLAEITGRVDPDATRIAFGPIMAGSGVVWYDQLELAVEGSDGSWTPVPVKDPGFEDQDLFSNWGRGTGRPSDASLTGWNVTLDHEYPAAGSSALRVEAATTTITDELFEDAPAPMETVDVELGMGLRARVPISLYSNNGHTIGDVPANTARSQGHDPVTVDEFNRFAAAADVIVVWNALEHFWPYWYLMPADWNTELDRALDASLDDRDIEDHVRTLKHLSAVAADGHASTACPGTLPRMTLPFLVDLVEGQLVVTATADSGVALGDVIISVNGKPALDQLSEDEALIGGSPQWRRARALRQFAAAPPTSPVQLRIRHDAREVDVTLQRGSHALQEFSHPAIEHVFNDIYYVDLARAEMPSIDQMIDKLAEARGVVFDVRGYPRSNHAVLSYLLTKPAETSKGMGIPNVIRPDHTRTSVLTWKTSEDQLPVREPHIRGRVAFLIGPNTISYAETIMAIVEYNKLGAIVGSATAGTNGNVAEVTTPTGCRTRFTGVHVTKPDGARFHLIGIQPTIPASRTLAGVAAGRDEVLEKALAYVRGDIQ
jgi:C-terminal processing protease CtpA/Prc